MFDTIWPAMNDVIQALCDKIFFILPAFGLAYLLQLMMVPAKGRDIYLPQGIVFYLLGYKVTRVQSVFICGLMLAFCFVCGWDGVKMCGLFILGYRICWLLDQALDFDMLQKQ